MRALETSCYRLHPRRILGFSRGRKWIVALSTCKMSIFGRPKGRNWLQSTIWPLESSLFRHTRNRILCWSRRRKWLPFGHMNRRFFELTQIAFWASQDAENEFAVHSTTWNIASLNSQKPHFEVVKRLIMSPECLVTTWNFYFSTSSKSHFVMVKRPKISSKWHAIPLIIAFSTSPKSQFRLVKRLKISSQWVPTTLKHRFINLTVVAFRLDKRKKMVS